MRYPVACVRCFETKLTIRVGYGENSRGAKQQAAEVVAKSAQTLLSNVKHKVTNVKSQVRIARGNLLEAASTDLVAMQDHLSVVPFIS